MLELCSLPVVSDHDDGEIVGDKSKTNGNGPKCTVYVVDDDPDMLDSVRWLVGSVGLKVEAFASAATFLAAFEPAAPGCIILDVRMPGLNGLDLQDNLRERGCLMPIIIVTGYADVPMAIRALKSGAMEFLQKPYRDQLLLDAVQRAIGIDARQRARAANRDDVRRRLQTLTPREMEVLRLVAEGLVSRQVADTLGITSKTVETHRTNIMKKMQAVNVAQLIRLYYEAQVEAE